MKSQIIIYSESVTPRLTYILDFIFGKIIGVTYKITSDFQVFLSSDLPKINYSFRESDELRVKPSGLLFQKGIEAVDTGYAKWNGMHCLFYNQDGAAIPFDLFSASFFLLTRYEEYLPYQADDHGRFSSDQSIVGKHKFLEEPVVQQWVGFLLNVLKLKFSNLTEKKQEFKIEPTIDVDVAFAFVYRNFGRFFMSSGRDFTTLKWNRIIDRILVTSKSKKDPFDTYSYIELIHKKYNFPVSVFYLIGDYSHYDRNIPYDSPEVKGLIKALSDKFSLGIHPSYKAADSADELKKK
ncbi:MAG: hypothetical protein HC830_08115 [Bacteroidetes bacterium]|nr:hypothetical protein [Bacteroidota bacterium]